MLHVGLLPLFPFPPLWGKPMESGSRNTGRASQIGLKSCLFLRDTAAARQSSNRHWAHEPIFSWHDKADTPRLPRRHFAKSWRKVGSSNCWTSDGITKALEITIYLRPLADGMQK